jgi:hypothetical protein
MKTACCVLIVIGSAALMSERAYPVPLTSSSQQPPAATAAETKSNGPGDMKRILSTDGLRPQANEKLADGSQRRRAVADENHSSDHSRPTKRNRSQQVSNKHHSNFGNTLNHYPTSSSNVRDAADVASVQEASKIAPVRPPSIARSNAPWLLNDVRHRSPNPAVVDGLATSNGKSASAIDGTRMHRKL